MPFLFDEKFTSNLPVDQVLRLQIKCLIDMQLVANRQLSEVVTGYKLVNDRLANGDEEMKSIKTILIDNTNITKHVQDAVTAGHVATKVIKWLGVVAVACTAAYTAWYMFMHGGRPPGTNE